MGSSSSKDESSLESTNDFLWGKRPSLHGAGGDGVLGSGGDAKNVVAKDEDIKGDDGELDPFDPENYDPKKYGPILPNGEINWDCPCLGGAAHGPCGTEFRGAFACFHDSKEEPKGSDCFPSFKEMHECFLKYPELYKSPDDDEEDEEDDEKGVEFDEEELKVLEEEQKEKETDKKKELVKKEEKEQDKDKTGEPLVKPLLPRKAYL